MRPSAPRWSWTATPTVAKSPARRSSFLYAEAVPAAGVGMRISTSSSSGSMAVWKESTKKSRAAMVRSPFTLRHTSEARVAMRTAGQSDDGSAWAQEPPIVPQLRTCGSPMPPAASWTTA